MRKGVMLAMGYWWQHLREMRSGGAQLRGSSCTWHTEDCEMCVVLCVCTQRAVCQRTALQCQICVKVAGTHLAEWRESALVSVQLQQAATDTAHSLEGLEQHS